MKKPTYLADPLVHADYDSAAAVRVRERDALVWQIAIDCATELVVSTTQPPNFVVEQLRKLARVGASYSPLPTPTTPRTAAPATPATTTPATPGTPEPQLLDCPSGINPCEPSCALCGGTGKTTPAIVRAMGAAQRAQKARA